ncbi:MAG: DUF2752 domain-containing protein [Bacteroidales bacterium]|nr:DUF2752 domain-containing protein [Bacteroidales bacterium]
MWKDLIVWLEEHQMPCIYKHYLGIDCPGCGMQTALIELLKGNIGESLIIYPPLIPILLMICLLIVHLVFRLKKGALMLKYLFIFTACLVVVNYLAKTFFNIT